MLPRVAASTVQRPALSHPPRPEKINHESHKLVICQPEARSAPSDLVQCEGGGERQGERQLAIETELTSADQSSHAVQRASVLPGPFLEARSKDPILYCIGCPFSLN